MTTEAATPPAPESPIPQTAEAQEVLSPRFAALSKKEKELQRAREALTAERQKLEVEKSGYIPKSELKTNLMKVLQEQGIGYEELSQVLLSAPGPQDQQLLKLQQRIDELEGKVTTTATSMEENQKRQYENALKQIHNEAAKLIETNADYETIKQLGAVDSVVDLIKQTFEADGQLLSVEEAAKRVEDELVEKGLKFANVSKIKSKLLPQQEEPVGQQPSVRQPISAQPQHQIRTLTNAATSTPSKPLSDKDRRARAIAVFKGELK